MVSKYQFQKSSLYYPNTNIPKNHLEITDWGLLSEIEAELLNAAYIEYAQLITPNTLFDLDFFVGLHHNTFYSLYDWAGIIRTENMSKGDSLFCQAAFLPKELNKLFSQLATEHYLKDAAQISTATFAKRIAYYQCELITLHPFYELNGRITRLFFDLLALINGYQPIDYELTLANNNQPQDYIQASIECVQFANNHKLLNIILNGLHKLETP